jgi:hypothetical protein
VLGLLLCGLVASTGVTRAQQGTTQTFNLTGNVQTFTVPEGVHSITVEVVGAAGGAGCDGADGGHGGKGASVKGTIPVTPGDTLGIVVGGQGHPGTYNMCNGGGGGGASIVWQCSSPECAPADLMGLQLLAVAGGGGGGAIRGNRIASLGVDGSLELFGTFGGRTLDRDSEGGAGLYGGQGGGGTMQSCSPFQCSSSGGGGGGGINYGGNGGGNGGVGGDGGSNALTGTSSFKGGLGNDSVNPACPGCGGYGGGGGGGYAIGGGGGGGGGGYGGGGGGSAELQRNGGGGHGGGGGGSYVSDDATDKVLTAGAGTGNGRVAFTFVLPDTTAPTTTATPSGSVGSNGWFRSNVNVSLAATDNAGGSGVASTHYTVDGGGGTYVGPVAVNGDGMHTVAYWSVDNVGNIEDAHTLPLQIDTAAPAVDCGVADGAWHANNIGIPCTASDATSGLANPANASFTLFTTVPSNTETANASTFTRAVTDRAGWLTIAGPLTGNKVDRKAPAIQCGAAPSGWHGDNVSIACAASDGGSGLANAADASFLLSTNVAPGAANGGAATGSRVVCDGVSNCGNAGPIGGISVDRQAPTTTATPSGTPGSGGWYISTAAVTLSAGDGSGSGIAATYYTIDAGPQRTYGGPFPIGDGTHAIAFWSVDAVGNAETAKSITVKVDTTVPSCVASASPNSIWPPNKQLVPVTITVNSSVGASGIASVAASVVTSNETLWPGDVVGFGLAPTTDSVATLTGQLRADREGKGNGRLYRQPFTVTTVAGTSATCVATVSVPHDQRN